MKKRTWVKSFFTQSRDDLENQEESKKANISLPEEASSEQIVKTDRNYSKSIVTNWVDIFQPKLPEDLALHPKKLLEVKQWFLDYLGASKKNSKSQICLMSGPTGAGKTAAVRVLAETLEFEIKEWINPLDQNVIGSLGDQQFGDNYVASALATFKSFLHQASRYRTLGGCKNRLLLVEDFPNALLKEPSCFEEILTNYLEYSTAPIVFIVSDSKSRGLNISYNLFPENLKEKLQITHISFNPIANTIMQKAMKRFRTLMQQLDVSDYKLPSQTVCDSIVLSAQGDVRNALINFHFSALKGAPEVLIAEEKRLNKTNKSKGSKKTSLKQMGRDESCTMLHAIGRVFNPKFSSERNFVHNPETIATDFSTEPNKFVDFLQANYLAHFSDIDHIALAADCLSISDMFLQEYRDHTLSTLGLNIATRGLMVANGKPVNGWMPVRGAKRFRPAESLKSSKLLTPNISRNLQVLDFQTYVQIFEQNAEKSGKTC